MRFCRARSNTCFCVIILQKIYLPFPLIKIAWTYVRLKKCNFEHVLENDLFKFVHI